MQETSNEMSSVAAKSDEINGNAAMLYERSSNVERPYQGSDKPRRSTKLLTFALLLAVPAALTGCNTTSSNCNPEYENCGSGTGGVYSGGAYYGGGAKGSSTSGSYDSSSSSSGVVYKGIGSSGMGSSGG